MTDGAFYQPKSTHPTALAVVVLMHGAAITALALAKMDVIHPPKFGPLVVDPIEMPKDPPKAPPDPPRTREHPRQTTVIDHPAPPIDLPFQGPVVDSTPTPQPPFVIPDPGPAIEPQQPPAPPPTVKFEPARARANLRSYVSDSDYPSSAMRNEEQGQTRFRLRVGPDGRVSECTVTVSSGSASLDSATCRLMKQRARFTPARDSSGRPTADTVASSIRWVLPEG